MKVLLAQVESSRLSSFARALCEQGFVVDAVPSAQLAALNARSFCYDLILLDDAILDRRLPLLCRDLRALGVTAPILAFVCGELLETLDAGADMCMRKPVEFAELLARTRALLRRSQTVKLPRKR